MPQGMTEEVCRQCEFAEMLAKIARFYCTSPTPFGGTLPKGEGMNLHDKHQFENPFAEEEKKWKSLKP